MKKSIKLAALMLIMIGVALSAKAQTTKTNSDGIRYSFGVESGVPTGSLNGTHDWSIGGSLQADFPIIQQLYFTLNAGYNNIFGRTDIYHSGTDAPDIHLLPVKAGFKYFPVSNFYIQGEAGAAFALNRSDVGYSNTAAFIYAPQIGVTIPVSSGSCIDVGVRFEESTNFTNNVDQSKVNFFGLRVAYSFGIK